MVGVDSLVVSAAILVESDGVVTHHHPRCTLVGVKSYTLLDRDRRPYDSPSPGTLGGHRRSRIYGRLDCPSALRWIGKGHYVQHRVFFADEEVAIAAGYRPCGHCLRLRYRQWLAANESRDVVDGVEPELNDRD
jgi:hypothetical protein